MDDIAVENEPAMHVLHDVPDPLPYVPAKQFWHAADTHSTKYVPLPQQVLLPLGRHRRTPLEQAGVHASQDSGNPSNDTFL